MPAPNCPWGLKQPVVGWCVSKLVLGCKTFVIWQTFHGGGKILPLLYGAYHKAESSWLVYYDSTKNCTREFVWFFPFLFMSPRISCWSSLMRIVSSATDQPFWSGWPLRYLVARRSDPECISKLIKYKYHRVIILVGYTVRAMQLRQRSGICDTRTVWILPGQWRLYLHQQLPHVVNHQHREGGLLQILLV